MISLDSARSHKVCATKQARLINARAGRSSLIDLYNMINRSIFRLVDSTARARGSLLIDLSDHIIPTLGSYARTPRQSGRQRGRVGARSIDLLDSTHVTKVCARKQARFD